MNNEKEKKTWKNRRTRRKRKKDSNQVEHEESKNEFTVKNVYGSDANQHKLINKTEHIKPSKDYPPLKQLLTEKTNKKVSVWTRNTISSTQEKHNQIIENKKVTIFQKAKKGYSILNSLPTFKNSPKLVFN